MTFLRSSSLQLWRRRLPHLHHHRHRHRHCASFTAFDLKGLLSDSDSDDAIPEHPSLFLRHGPPPRPAGTLTLPLTMDGRQGISSLTDWWIHCFRNRAGKLETLTPMLERFEIWAMAYRRACLDILGGGRDPSEEAESAPFLFNLQEAVLKGEFVWGGGERVYLLSPIEEKVVVEGRSKTQRRLFRARVCSNPVFQDSVVQEVLLMLLEPVFEPRFSPKSHGFRPGRNAHTALRAVRRSFGPCIWFINGDCEHLFLNPINPNRVLNTISNVIKDKHVLDLIKCGLNTPLSPPLPSPNAKKLKKKLKKSGLRKLPNGPKPFPYWLKLFFEFAPDSSSNPPNWGSFTVLTPVLLNMCLDQFDRFMEEKSETFFKPSATDFVGSDLTQPDRDTHFVPSSPKEKTQKMEYIRYGTHFLVGIRGPHYMASETRSKIASFFEDTFGINLSEDCIPIQHVSKGVLFLDHVISRKVVHPRKKDFDQNGQIVAKKQIGTVLTMNISIEQCIAHLRKLRLLKGTTDAQPMFCLFHASQEFSNAQVNKLLIILSEVFRYADNRKQAVMFCQYILKSSLAKMYAAKYKLRTRRQVYKAGGGDLRRPIEGRKGSSEHYKRMLKEGLVEKSVDCLKFSKVRFIPGTDWTTLPQKWVPEHEKFLEEIVLMQMPGMIERKLRLLNASNLVSPQELMAELGWKFQRAQKGNEEGQNDTVSEREDCIEERSESIYCDNQTIAAEEENEDTDNDYSGM